jgi:muconate cycloisomerase
MHTLSMTPDAARKARLARVQVHHVRIPLRKPVVHASHARSESENIVVACHLTDGTVGYGEGVPRDYVTGETAESCWDLLHRVDFSLLEEDVQTPAEGVELARRMELPRLAADPRDCQTNVTRCALELALLDAFGRSLGISALEMLVADGRYREILEPRRSCRYSGVITSKPSLRKEVMSALKMRFNWFPCVKVKVGTEGQDDPRRLRLFRQLVGTIDIRVDANEAWSPGEAAERIGELEPAGISAVEQPLRHEDFESLAGLRRRVRTPIMLDESLCSMVDAERAIAAEACDLFNIRLSKCGGLIRSLDLALRAHRAGLGYQLGCQVGETGILSAAGRTFACGVKNIRYVEGSYDQYLVRERLTRENLTFEWRGWAPRLLGAGLGMNVDPAKLQSVTIREATIHG